VPAHRRSPTLVQTLAGIVGERCPAGCRRRRSLQFNGQSRISGTDVELIAQSCQGVNYPVVTVQSLGVLEKRQHILGGQFTEVRIVEIKAPLTRDLRQLQHCDQAARLNSLKDETRRAFDGATAPARSGSPPDSRLGSTCYRTLAALQQPDNVSGWDAPRLSVFAFERQAERLTHVVRVRRETSLGRTNP
jgi:hypothetical protein